MLWLVMIAFIFKVYANPGRPKPCVRARHSTECRCRNVSYHIAVLRYVKAFSQL